MIVVTGASRGLGRAICERLTDGGRSVLGLSRSAPASAWRTAACDVADAESVKAVARTLRRENAAVEAVVNAAGIASMNLALTMPAEQVQRIVQVNLLGTIWCCQQFAPLMVRRKAGRIVNFSTIAVALGLEGEAAYVASKAGVEAFTRTFAREVAAFGITANCIAPGPVATDLIAGVSAAQVDRIVQRQVARRQFTPADVCDLVELLLDRRAQSLTGQVLHVGGA